MERTPQVGDLIIGKKEWRERANREWLIGRVFRIADFRAAVGIDEDQFGFDYAMVDLETLDGQKNNMVVNGHTVSLAGHYFGRFTLL